MGDEKAPTTQQTGNLPNAEYRRFEGMREYESLLDGLIPQTQRAIRVFDNSLSPSWNTPERFEALRQFLLAHRSNRLLIVVHDAEPIQRERPRMVELVQQFGTAVRIHSDRKSTRLNSSHVEISYAVFCLKKKKAHQLHVVERRH